MPRFVSVFRICGRVTNRYIYLYRPNDVYLRIFAKFTTYKVIM